MSEAQIKIISGPPATSPALKAEYLPREGEEITAEEHFGFAFFTKKPVKHLTDQVDELKGKMGTVVRSLSEAVAENVELETITVGLAVSVDGDIGIASAGAEASIQMSYRIKR